VCSFINRSQGFGETDCFYLKTCRHRQHVPSKLW